MYLLGSAVAIFALAQVAVAGAGAVTPDELRLVARDPILLRRALVGALRLERRSNALSTIRSGDRKPVTNTAGVHYRTRGGGGQSSQSQNAQGLAAARAQLHD